MPTTIPFDKVLEFNYGLVDQLTPLVRRVIANNPSPFTFYGTGTYIVGRGQVAIIDPGPDLADHIDAVLAAVSGETVSHILVTHTHLDHSPAARHIKAHTRAPTFAFGPHGSKRAGPKVEEGADHDFVPDHTLHDGDLITGEAWSLEAVHTPGHTSNHMCFGLREEKALFCGDHVMGWSTSVISPPDGDMQAYMRSLRKLLERDDRVYWPTHGGPIMDPQGFVSAFIAHREEREEQIERCLTDGISSIQAMVETIYSDVPSYLHPAAARSVLAHLIHMVETGRVRCDGPPSETSRYSAASEAVGSS